MDRLFYLADLFGVAVFAITGALMAGRKSMDLFGVLVIAIVTALGGGTLRDLILDNHPVSWIRNDTYIWVASLAAVGTVLWVRMTQPIHERGLLIADAFGLAVFTVIGTEVALQHNMPHSTALIMGVMTGVAGGMMRDIVCRQIPLILRKEVYATACIAGCSCYILLAHYWQLDDALAMAIGMAVTALVRLAAIIWQLQLPAFHLQPQRR